ncbi:hypothetical protein [Aquimarina mytili]|uniref:Uncharacterized protein n=1 Tax=Aquimarina mytili TaxID=874423 RepID=A0A936ZU29_9FLAO|nr:hypothetical protein [Aquimarina mytili]MBL0684322.1 hypothetical protein [Aquimarina mytili]
MIKGVIAFLVVTLSLFHIFLEPKSKEQIEFSPKYKAEVRKLDSLQLHYINQLENKELTASEYAIIAKKHLASYEPSLKKISKKRLELAKEHSFRGRSSLHFWIFVFGLVTALFFFSCKSLHDDFARGSTFRFHFVSLAGILVSFFWFIHLIFLTQKDFTQNKYIIAILAGATLFSVFTYFLVKHYTYKDHIIYEQLRFFERIRIIHYPRMTKNAKHAEKVGLVAKSDLDNDIDEFQDDLRESISNI